jgi:hypothetical protein
MAVSKSVSTTAGVDLSAKYTTSSALPLKPPPLGTVVRAANGRMYILAQSTGSIANDTAVILTEPAMTFAAGAGAFTTRSGAVVSGDQVWLESNAI